MIPIIVAEEVKETILDYLQANFAFQDERLVKALEDLILHDKKGIFKGPYINMKLPFRTAKPEELIPMEIRPAFTPYAHQLKAFQNLTSQNNNPKSTLITTGTGSGKTECFLYPILDYCYKHQREPGIKAIILYPMNALAFDQSTRLAKLIYKDERLRNVIRAGIYVGGEGHKRQIMGPDHLIEDKDFMRHNPPDILLTNYKMLDYLLMRPEDQLLWINSPGLKFLVLDELHTYDGIQGSDVACLIRRLKAKLSLSKGKLCCIGTSATIASEGTNEAQKDLREFAQKIFDEDFDESSIVEEDRLKVSEYFNQEIQFIDYPDDLEALKLKHEDNINSYLTRQKEAWFDNNEFNEMEIAQKLKVHRFLKLILSCLNNKIEKIEKLCEKLSLLDQEFANQSVENQKHIVESFLSLVSYARSEDNKPFLSVQVQFWTREMSRLLREVQEESKFYWLDNKDKEKVGLPPYYCRECGHSGWLSYKLATSDNLEGDYKKIIERYFRYDKNMVYVFPGKRTDKLDVFENKLCPKCLKLSNSETCKECDVNNIPVIIHSLSSQGDNPKDKRQCPMCETDNALSIIGAQAATLGAVAINHIYTTSFNKDKKLLSFVDSVQDAAHRAGFFTARTYRFNLRSAIQKIIDSQESVTLKNLPEMVIKHWFDQENDFRKIVATFLPPDLKNREKYQNFIKGDNKSINDDIYKEVKERIIWEVLAEFGFNSRRGRTLDKVSASTILFSERLINKSILSINELLKNECCIDSLTDESIRFFIFGLLTRMKFRGAIYDTILQSFCENDGNSFVHNKFNKIFKINAYNPQTKLVSSSPSHKYLDTYKAKINDSRLTWLAKWSNRFLGNIHPNDRNECLDKIFEKLANEGLLIQKDSKNGKLFGLNPECMEITNETSKLKCQECGHIITIPKTQNDIWLNLPCLEYRCNGYYEEYIEAEKKHSFYRQIYKAGELRRIFAHEHTGILERKYREDLEVEFRSENKVDAVNLLSCTPTLEMGIDVGDLSAIMLCSVPPDTSNYLQRIGRAGRETGNAFILSFANVKPHDLYFWEDPKEIMSGEIIPPGCYLDAPEILKRHFLSFCFDNWSYENYDKSINFSDVGRLVDRYPNKGFIKSFLDYFIPRRDTLRDEFLKVFRSTLSESNIKKLVDDINSNIIEEDIKFHIIKKSQTIKEKRNQRKSITDKIRYKEQESDHNKALEKELQNEIDELIKEKTILSMVLSKETKRPALEFLTNCGLLPNYAFPETGATLNALVLYPKDSNNKSDEYEIVRPASSAIKEFAPFNNFYALGRKFPVQRIEVGRLNSSKIENWQLCDRCGHSENIETSNYAKVCPVCQSSNWNDTGQKHKLLKIENVESVVSSENSQISDDSDDRDQENYQVIDLIDIKKDNYNFGFADESLPFGFEYLKQVSLRELNLGLNVQAEKININSKEVSAPGFIVCKDCGIAINPNDNNHQEVRHRYNCKFKTNGKDTKWDEKIFLYREMQSESLRILLPFSSYQSELYFATFQAALYLGLKKYFRGKQDHLILRPLTEYEENLDSPADKQFIIIYDTVPGGTGILRELVEKKTFMNVIEAALDTLKACKCNEDIGQPDGCYRCLFSYSSQYKMEDISKSRAITLLEKIVNSKESLKKVETLSAIKIDSVLESELEVRFIELLKKESENNHYWKIEEEIKNGKRCYRLSITQNNHNTVWIVEPQVELNEYQGINAWSKPDFLIKPINNKNTKKIAVFTDGYSVHVKPDQKKSEIRTDIRKRKAIIDSNDYLVWSITWDDIENYENKDNKNNCFNLFTQGVLINLDQFISRLNLKIPKDILNLNSFALLIQLLKSPNYNEWNNFVQLLYACLLVDQTARSCNKSKINKIFESYLTIVDLNLSKEFNNINSESCDTKYQVINKNECELIIHNEPNTILDSLKTYSGKPNDLLKIKKDEFSCVLRLNDQLQQRSNLNLFKQSWQVFLYLINLFQFIDDLQIVSSEYIEKYGPIEIAKFEDKKEFPPDYSGNFKYSDPICEEIATYCLNSEQELPVICYEFKNDLDQIMGEIELAWPSQKLGMYLEYQSENLDTLLNNGWKLFEISTIRENYKILLQEEIK